ncbi:hypothetical protein M758_UG022500 [Ceratodon purpureus]|nr:hypothetical protein M758_UG022500 [Ceratodon purpureus]
MGVTLGHPTQHVNHTYSSIMLRQRNPCPPGRCLHRVSRRQWKRVTHRCHVTDPVYIPCFCIIWTAHMAPIVMFCIKSSIMGLSLPIEAVILRYMASTPSTDVVIVYVVDIALLTSSAKCWESTGPE